MIHEILNYLSGHEHSIVNIKINETRIDINGVLQITFKTVNDLETAEDLIKTHTSYDVYK